MLTREDLAAWEKKAPASARQLLRRHAFRLGAARRRSAKYTGKDAAGVFHFPGVSPEAAQWLMKERKVLGLAVDTLSLDDGTSKDFKVHYAWLPSGRWGLENVAHLDQVPASARRWSSGCRR